MGRRIVVLSAVIALAGCNSPDDVTKNGAEDLVRKSLKDPDSAKFSSEFIVRSKPDEKGIVFVGVCGLVNARNGFGGYAGNARFVAVSSESSQVGPSYPFMAQIENSKTSRPGTAADGTRRATIFESVYWNQYCVDAAHPPMFTAGMD
ncbi:hypothetical protein [Caballeronia sp. GAWG1-5s-s]|uniref:hypothetical protein n=1 Tax=Caballeronia sp. GAWG1-5s-s TaxID=2921743 RepID=UPI00202888CC|nr:hypothetical protein [Caballeronia sp. GAWG1-5s-s]